MTTDLIPQVATVLTACGIETIECYQLIFAFHLLVATVLTACGIETYKIGLYRL